MRIINGMNQLVLRKVTIRMLVKIAFLADYYDCHEAVEVAGNTRIDWALRLSQHVVHFTCSPQGLYVMSDNSSTLFLNSKHCCASIESYF